MLGSRFRTLPVIGFNEMIKVFAPEPRANFSSNAVLLDDASYSIPYLFRLLTQRLIPQQVFAFVGDVYVVEAAFIDIKSIRIKLIDFVKNVI